MEGKTSRAGFGECTYTRGVASTGMGVGCLPREATSNFPHDDQDDQEGTAHDELPPVEVWGPCVTKQVTQLLVDRIMPRVGNSLGSCGSSLRNNVLTVPKKELDLQKGDSWMLPLHAS